MADCAASKHGNESAYVNHGCRCEEARADRAHMQKQRRVTAQLHGPKLVDSTGAARRLQALASIGWSAEDIAEQLGVSQRAVEKWRAGEYATVAPRTAARVGRLYEELQGTAGPSPRSRENATRSGWAPPLLWHDRNIDDPAAEPERDRPAPQRGVDLAEVRFLESCRESRDQIAKQMGVQVSAIERAEFRAQARAREALATGSATAPVEWIPAQQMGDDHAMAR